VIGELRGGVREVFLGWTKSDASVLLAAIGENFGSLSCQLNATAAGWLRAVLEMVHFSVGA
jgi:hypothetical protein